MNFRKQCKFRKGGQRGFTLVELLLVLVILALIAGLVLPGIIGKAESAKAKAASSQISRISMSVESFYLDTGNPPSSLEELVNEPSGVNGWNGPYIKNSLLTDPWVSPTNIQCRVSTVILISCPTEPTVNRVVKKTMLTSTVGIKGIAELQRISERIA